MTYTEYEAIPSSIASYLVSIGDVDNIAEISLDDINDFLNELEENNRDWHNDANQSEYEGRW